MKLNEKYNQDSFINFINTFLPEDFKSKEEDIIIKKDRYKEITKAKILGFCESLDLHVLEMDHTHDKDPRVSIATDAFKILADHWIHRALVVFKNNDSENYRFSYLTITLDLNDKNKVIKKYSNARRYSFYLGVNAKIKTPEQQLVKNGKVKDIDDLLNRFSVEVVNKQFYLEVAKFFDELVSMEVNNLILPGLSESDLNIRKSFAVRLIGRTMFCWFLKQKKSDNGQLIPDELLSSKIVSNNYYHNILEPLFFGVLNTSIDSRDIRSELFDKVPYLNGGLFNPQSEDYYELDRGTFASKYINTLKVNEGWFKRFFELLETYNFTIDENTVFDQELSVDPEMLGRIFENLLAEINPETGSSERKRTGSFYTPRQIVEYMVDQSLIEYFKTKTTISESKLSAVVSYDLADDSEHPLNDIEKQEIINAIESLKILDPACGSGAYPIGALQKIVYILQQIDPDCKMWLEKKLKDIPDLYKQKIINDIKQNPFDYTRKLDVIKNSIFGVDIQPIAVDVSRLRCFLTLVVEQNINDHAENRNIKPLPNLDFKFVCADTLISAPEQHPSDKTSLFGDDFQEKLALTVDKYFSSSGENKRSANNEIHKLIDNKVDEKLRYLNNLVSYNGDKKMESLLAKANKKKIDEHSNILHLWSSYKNIFENKAVGFFEIKYFFPSVKEGFDIVIGNPPYITLSLGKKQSHFTLEYLKTLELLFSEVKEYKNNTFSYFIKRAYDLSNKDGVISYIVPNVLLFNGSFSKVRKYMLDNSSITYILDIKDKVFETAETGGNCVFISNKSKKTNTTRVLTLQDVDDLTVPRYETLEQDRFNLPPDFKFYIDSQSFNVFEKIENGGKRLSEFCNFYNGIKTGDNKRFLRESKVDDIDELVIRGREVQKYYLSKASIYVHFDKNELWSNTNEENLRKSPKILVRQTGDSIICAIDNDGSLHMDTTHGLFDIKINIFYLVGLLNSKVISYWHRAYTSEKGRAFAEVKIANIKNIPIKLPESEEIINLVQIIIESKRIDNDIEITEIELKINELVMDLYGLDDSEKEIIRNS
jgi:hypothetical protein